MANRFNPHKMYNGIYIPDGIYSCEVISALSKLVYGRLLRYSGSNGKAYPKQETMALELGVSRSGIVNAIKQLVQNDLIEIEKGSRLNHEPDTYYFLESEYLGMCTIKTSECTQSTHRDVHKVHIDKDKESHVKESHNKETTFLYDLWNESKHHCTHRKLKPEISAAYKSLLKDGYKFEEIKAAIKLYDTVSGSSKSWVSGHWTLKEFLSQANACRKYIDNKNTAWLRDNSKANTLKQEAIVSGY